MPCWELTAEPFVIDTLDALGRVSIILFLNKREPQRTRVREEESLMSLLSLDDERMGIRAYSGCLLACNLSVSRDDAGYKNKREEHRKICMSRE